MAKYLFLNFPSQGNQKVFALICNSSRKTYHLREKDIDEVCNSQAQIMYILFYHLLCSRIICLRSIKDHLACYTASLSCKRMEFACCIFLHRFLRGSD